MTSQTTITKKCICYWEDHWNINLYRMTCPIPEHKIECYKHEIKDIIQRLQWLHDGLDFNGDKDWKY